MDQPIAAADHAMHEISDQALEMMKKLARETNQPLMPLICVTAGKVVGMKALSMPPDQREKVLQMANEIFDWAARLYVKDMAPQTPAKTGPDVH